MAALPPPPLPPPVPPFLTRLLLAHPPPPSHHSYSPTPSHPHYPNHPHTISNSSSINSFSPTTSPLLLGTRSPPLPPGTTTYGPQPQMPPQPLYLPPPVMEDEVPELEGPENFSMVSAGIYRSSFPKKKHFGFLKELGLKTVFSCLAFFLISRTLILEEYPPASLKFLEEEGIQFKQFGIPGNKEPFDQIPEEIITAALVTLLDRRNHPVLIHCNKGKHRTGCLVGCLRRLQSWSLTSTFDEYRRFSSPKSRAVDQQFIELFKTAEVWNEVERQQTGAWVPWWETLPRIIRKGRREDAEILAVEGEDVQREVVLARSRRMVLGL